VSKDAHRASTSISQRDHSSSLLTDCIRVENEKVANSHSKKEKAEVMILLKVLIIKYLQTVALEVGTYKYVILEVLVKLL
jgi:hypothetical protein